MASILKGATLDSSCDVSAATGAGGGPATELDANGTTLTVDAIADGEFLKRVGTTIVSAAAGGGSGLTQPEVMARSFCKC